MTNEHKAIPKLRFSGFENEWEEKKLGDISKSAMYGIGTSAVAFDFQNVYIRITDIDENTRKLKKQNFTSPNEINKKYLVKKMIYYLHELVQVLVKVIFIEVFPLITIIILQVS